VNIAFRVPNKEERAATIDYGVFEGRVP